jgi:hypothetical protein
MRLSHCNIDTYSESCDAAHDAAGNGSAYGPRRPGEVSPYPCTRSGSHADSCGRSNKPVEGNLEDVVVIAPALFTPDEGDADRGAMRGARDKIEGIRLIPGAD